MSRGNATIRPELHVLQWCRAAARAGKQKANFTDGFDAAAAKYHYDTAWTSNDVAQSALSKMIPVSHIVLGTDYPARDIGATGWAAKIAESTRRSSSARSSPKRPFSRP
jgi:hypothetical protein